MYAPTNWWTGYSAKCDPVTVQSTDVVAGLMMGGFLLALTLVLWRRSHALPEDPLLE